MAGTNTAKENTKPIPLAPAVILVRPQLGQNIGMCARAMLNCAVTELRIVKPRDGWPNPDATAAASGAIALLENAKIFETTAEAVADLDFVVATTARERGIVKDIYTAEAAAKEIRARNTSTQRCGIMFGPERTGLESDDVALATAIVNIPLNPSFSSLNLAQAVLLTCYAWLNAENPFREEQVIAETGDTAPATKGDVENLMKHLEDDLDTGGFFRSPEQRPTILRNIGNFFFRSNMTQQDVRTMHGIFSCLTGKRSWK
ncbi:MAG TPA: RNA methyltransferase [Patescibacteria group bacterium]|nr:RNA methyltransferase [Patescibacteria group bacterium]